MFNTFNKILEVIENRSKLQEIAKKRPSWSKINLNWTCMKNIIISI